MASTSTTMALLQAEANKSLKRTSSYAGFNDSSQVKLRRTQIHHHSLRHKSKAGNGQTAALQDYAQAQELLDRSIALALQAVGFQAVEPLALQSFRGLVEEYMAHVLSSVHKSMLASRRTQSIPQDYLYALHSHQLSLRALKIHLDPPVPPEKSVIALELEAESIQDSSFQTPDLNGHLDESFQQPLTHLPKHFPRLPSSHTYKSTSRYLIRESDPKRIRERVTEEGRLGEAALRNFVGAGSKSYYEGAEDGATKSTGTLREKRFAMWKEAMMVDEDAECDNDAGLDTTDLLTRTTNPEEQRTSLSKTFSIGPIVNADQAFLQKPAPARRSRPTQERTAANPDFGQG